MFVKIDKTSNRERLNITYTPLPLTESGRGSFGQSLSVYPFQTLDFFYPSESVGFTNRVEKSFLRDLNTSNDHDVIWFLDHNQNSEYEEFCLFHGGLFHGFCRSLGHVMETYDLGVSEAMRVVYHDSLFYWDSILHLTSEFRYKHRFNAPTNNPLSQSVMYSWMLGLPKGNVSSYLGLMGYSNELAEKINPLMVNYNMDNGEHYRDKSKSFIEHVGLAAILAIDSGKETTVDIANGDYQLSFYPLRACVGVQGLAVRLPTDDVVFIRDAKLAPKSKNEFGEAIDESPILIGKNGKELSAKKLTRMIISRLSYGAILKFKASNLGHIGEDDFMQSLRTFETG